MGSHQCDGRLPAPVMTEAASNSRSQTSGGKRHQAPTSHRMKDQFQADYRPQREKNHVPKEITEKHMTTRRRRVSFPWTHTRTRYALLRKSRELPGLPWCLSGTESHCHAGDVRSTPESGRAPGGGTATHSSILAWETPRTEEPGGSHRAATEHTRMHKAYLKVAVRTDLKTVFTMI